MKNDWLRIYIVRTHVYIHTYMTNWIKLIAINIRERERLAMRSHSERYWVHFTDKSSLEATSADITLKLKKFG